MSRRKPILSLILPVSRFVSICSIFVLGLCARAPAAPIAPPQDKPYPGTLVLKVDATDLQRGIFQIHETIPVAPGHLTLLYPQWLPGNHSPNGQIAELAGLLLTASGQRLEWHRDTINMFAFHVEIPAGITTLDADFQFVSPVDGAQGRITMTPEILGIQWNAVTLYPAGYYASRIQVEPSAVLPEGWQFGSALELSEKKGNEAHFKTTTLSILVDSPLFAGRYFKRFDLDPGGRIPIFLDVVADRPDELNAKPEQIAAHRALVQQAGKLYGSHHYDHYDFLLSISDRFGGIGLEHHRSSENGVHPGYFTEWDKGAPGRDILPHEYTHSWDGKFRRPADLWTANFNVPMQDSLLWVYEGQTQYWGFVLSARSGLISAPLVRDALADVAATYDHQIGRSWRNLQDTTNAPIIEQRRNQAWSDWQRSADYYSEGQLIWLDADSKIRELSNEKRSLNDFAREFFGVKDGSFEALTYTFDDVVAALNKVEPYDWKAFLRARLDGHGPGAPLDGLARSGWKLVYTDQPNEYLKSAQERYHFTDFTYSLGFSLDKEDTIRQVAWQGPAFKAGRTVGEKLLAVNGYSYKEELLRIAITDAKTNKTPIELLFKKGDLYTTVRIDYDEGLKYPHLERLEGTPDRLDAILEPLS